jgi:hypothetical protein
MTCWDSVRTKLGHILTHTCAFLSGKDLPCLSVGKLRIPMTYGIEIFRSDHMHQTELEVGMDSHPEVMQVLNLGLSGAEIWGFGFHLECRILRSSLEG